MNYERLKFCCLVEIEIEFVKIYIFLKLSSLPLFFSGGFFLTLWWSCITREQRIWRWCQSLVNWWRSFILFVILWRFFY